MGLADVDHVEVDAVAPGRVHLAQPTGPAEIAEEVAGTHTVESALASIPEEFRMVLVLADVHDMAYEQISKVLDVPVGTVKSRLTRARQALRAELLGLRG